MSLAAVVDALIASGGTLEQVAAVVRAHETATTAPKPKSSAAIRQARYRAKSSQNITRDVTRNEGDGSNGVVTGYLPPIPDKEIPPTPPKENNPYPEENPSPAKAGSAPLSGKPARVSDEALLSEALSIFNEVGRTAGWPKVTKLSDDRRKKLRCRLADAGGIDGWRDAIERAGRSPHLTGENDRGWVADFDFFMRESRFLKTLEGGYGDKTSQRSIQQRSDFSRSAADQIISAGRRAIARRNSGGWSPSEGSSDFFRDEAPDDDRCRSPGFDHDGQEAGYRNSDGDISALFLPAPGRLVGSH